MLNTLWIVMLLSSVVCGAYTGRLAEVAQASFESAGQAVTLALGLVGVMTFWLGLMKVLHEGGVLRAMGHAMRPLMVRLFPSVPADHPAMSMMILNLSANMMGLGNAATPFGLKAMGALESLNPDKRRASDAMILFLAINTSGLAVFPTGIMAIRAALGSQAPGAIFLTTLISTSLATAMAILSAKALAPLSYFRRAPELSEDPAAPPQGAFAGDDAASRALAPDGAYLMPPSRLRDVICWAALLLCVGAFAYALAQLGSTSWLAAIKTAFSSWTVLFLIVGFVLFGCLRGVKVYDALVDGGKEGFATAQRIIPFMVAILVAVGMLRASGGIDLLVHLVDPLTRALGMPPEALPMAFLRPLTGSGALAVAADTMKAHGPDSLVGQVVSTINGSTETTFYVMALYLGVTQARDTRYALIPCLLADLVGTFSAVWTCRLLLQG